MTTGEHTDAAALRIAAFLGHGISEALVERMRARPTLRRHLARVISARLDVDTAENPMQSAAFGLDREGVAELALRTGIVWHATAISASIDADLRRRLIVDIGEEHYALALAARAASVEAPRVAMPSMPMTSAAAQEGASCIAAWRDTQPQQVADRLGLFWPDAEMNEMHRRYAPAIVAWLLSRTRER